MPVDADTVVTQEIACATGVGAAEVSRRLELATTPRRHRVLHEALRAGTVSLYRALRVVAETRLLPDVLLPALETAVLAPAPDGSVASQRLFSTRLARHVRSADDRSGDKRRSARAAGDSRTLDQLRSDAICSLALFGSLAAEHNSFGGTMPAAAVRIVVPFEVATGVSDAACELPGHGWVTAAHARRIMTAEGSVWQRLAVDVDTGRALELSTDRYGPTRAMVEHVRAVDGVCRAPGCQVPADRCDLDHLVPWPQGATDVTNAQSLSRLCHNPKTAGLWSAARAPDDGIRWTTMTGREYVTYPRDWREALDDAGASPPTTAPPLCDPAPF